MIKTQIYGYATLLLATSAYVATLILCTKFGDGLLATIAPSAIIAGVGGVCFYLAERCQRSGFVGFAAGVIFGPLAIFYYYELRNKDGR